MDNRVTEEENHLTTSNQLEGKTQCASSQSILNSRPSYHHEPSYDRPNSINIIQDDNFYDEPIVASLPTHLEEFPSRFHPELNKGFQPPKGVDGEIGKFTEGTKRFEMFSFPTEYPKVTSTREMDNIRAFSEDNKTRSVLHDEGRSYGTFQPRHSGCEVVLGDGSVTKWMTGPSLSFDQNRLSISDSTLNLNEPLIPTKQPPLNPTTPSPPSPYRWPLSDYKLTPSHKSVIKSTLSYFIGSMLTFIPALRATIGTSSHMAAISGFFLNPGMSVGKFVESMTFGIGFIVYGLTVGYLSLANMAFWNRQGYPEVGRRSTLFLFIGVASFILAYIKARYPKPTIIKCIPNAFIFIYLVLVNYTPFVEDSHNPFKIYDLAKALTSGILINFIVCTQLWPRWEADNLREDMVTTLNSFHTTLQAIVKTFLLENRDDKGIDKIMEAHRKSFLTLKQRYESTQWEFTLEPERYELLGNVVDRLNRLSQKLGGLSSSIDAQKELLQDFSLDARRLSKFPQFMNRYRQSDIIIDVDKVPKETHPKDSEDPEPDVEVLMAFLKYVNLPTKSLVYTCQQAMLRLSQLVVLNESGHHHPPPSSQPGSPEFISVGQLRDNINSALEIFSKAQSKAVSTLYRRTRYDGRPDEEIFLVYFFVFSLEEFANELILTISAMEALSLVPPLPGSQRWILFRSLFSALKNGVHSLWTMAHDHLNEELPESDSNAPLHSPAHQTFGQRLSARFWYFLMSLRDHRFIFAAKAALAAMLIASPIYLGDQRENFRDWRVGWTMITVSLVMSPTLGASNIYGLYRSLGTVVGSLIAYIVYSIFSHNLFALATVSTLIAAPCMYVFLVTAYPRFGQFILLSYNLVVLTTYANRHDVEFSFAEYAFIRSFSVLLGVGIGLLFSFLIFPYEARKELRLGLSDFFLKTSSLYIKLVSMYSLPEPPGVSGVSGMSSRVSIINEDPHYLASCGDFLETELALQVQLLDLGGLLANTAHEPRLKGPFPIATYRRILQSCQVLLDKFVAMRVVITKAEWSARVRDDFVVPLNRYREDLVGSIILYFYLLASALHLKSPLPPFFPPAAHARRQLVLALRDLPVVRNRYLHQDDDHHIMYYAFIVVLDDIISELESLGVLFKQLYGCQGETAFADLFRILDARPLPSPTTSHCKLSPRPPSPPSIPRK